MSKQYIRDNSFRIIGSIDTSDNEQRAYDAHFGFLGRYDCRSDRTYNKSFSYVGDGNQLVGLIGQAAGK